ncbi:claudin-8-like [Mastacembelus armatus]|uniref:claudin-8-like n=1 Tax=Mastacembelus armatus TaxID=205130 RepID=UPI000E4587CA|nr:claudin-8-like [Mastacembelus armatus]
MVHGVSEIAALCVGLIGLTGAAVTTGMPMWKVTAFIGPNIIVMETLWEGLWMNCYRQANIRMQCKVYDSLLILPPELQAARGLMCCSLALSGLGFLVGLAGMRCSSCFQGGHRVKTVILMVAGGLQLMACICVFIPVSWTGHIIIRDFYNPLLIDAQRRELGEALYIGWVSGALLFASAMLFVCRHLPSDKGSFDVYYPANLHGCPLTYPISRVSSLRSTAYQPSLQNSGSVGQQALALQNAPRLMTHDGALINPPVVYNLSLPVNAPLLHQGSMTYHSSMQNANDVGSLYTPENSLYMSQNTTPYLLTNTDNSTTLSSFHPVPHTPLFIQYKESRIQKSGKGSSNGVYI